ncbi:MAG TPA: histidine phosphatase family protein [Stenotrophomonas sp.]|nr:histidine phosphatase family protein [Stenotrophomonas sp.]
MTRFLLVRHANTDANGQHLAGRSQGVGLNAQGLRQAEALARRLSAWPITAIYASPLERAMQTATPIANLRGQTIRSCEDFLELDFGAWTRKRFDELADDDDFMTFNALRSCAATPAGEFMLQAQARMVMGLDRLRRQHPEETVVVVSHGDMIRAAVLHYAGIALDMFQRIEISPASLSVVDVETRWIRVLRVNDTGEEIP